MMVFIFIIFGILAVLAAFVGSFLVGFIWGGLLKLGVVGRILTTLITACPLLLIIWGFNLGYYDTYISFGTGAIVMAVLVGLLILLPVWYFFWHYYAIESMGVAEFAMTLKTPIILFFAGPALFSLIGMFGKAGAIIGGICFALCLIGGPVYYFVKTREYSCPNPKEFIVRWVAILVAVVVSVITGNTFTNNISKAEAAIKNVSNQPLAIYYSTKAIVNLRAEPSGAGKVIKTLGSDDEITATGNTAGLWTPVESGGGKGYVFAPFMTLKDARTNKSLFSESYEAVVPSSVTLTIISDKRDIKIPKGAEVTVEGVFLDKHVNVEYKNMHYQVERAVAETFEPKLNADGSIVTVSGGMPAEFKKKNPPFNATVTEDIEYGRYTKETGQKYFTIPKGTAVSVTKKSDGYGTVSYNGHNAVIYWKYLVPAD